MIALGTGFLLDLIIGDPYNMPHPIRLIGRIIAALDKRFNIQEKGREKENIVRGFIVWLIVLIMTGATTLGIIVGTYLVNIILGIVIEALLTCYILATKSLRYESMKVYKPLKDNDLDGARKAVSMIVGRDTDCLDMEGVTKACVETIAENTSDGVIAPLLYTCIGGPVLGFMYKAINTMDSMLGYHNDRYEYFGKFAAKADDVVNFIPSRLSAYIMLVASIFNSEYDTAAGYRIFKRDRFNHKSPNSAQTESLVAGLLNIRLAGDASYFGKIVKKPYIGDANREIETEDIRRTNRLMYMTAILALVMCEAAMAVLLIMI